MDGACAFSKRYFYFCIYLFFYQVVGTRSVSLDKFHVYPYHCFHRFHAFQPNISIYYVFRNFVLSVVTQQLRVAKGEVGSWKHELGMNQCWEHMFSKSTIQASQQIILIEFHGTFFLDSLAISYLLIVVNFLICFILNSSLRHLYALSLRHLYASEPEG